MHNTTFKNYCSDDCSKSQFECPEPFPLQVFQILLDSNMTKPGYFQIFILVIAVFAFFGIHTLLWLPRSLKERKKRKHTKPVGEAYYIRRFSRSHRVTHIFVMLSFILLALTGMTLKFANMEWAKWLAKAIGGAYIAGIIHRFAAIITFGYFIFHILSLLGIKFKKGYFQFRSLGKAHVIGKITGFIKILSDEHSGKILGVHIIGPHASDLIHEGALAIRKGLQARDLADTIHAHPTLSEGLMEAAGDLYGESIHVMRT